MGDLSRTLERMIYTFPSIDKSEYPTVSEDEMVVSLGSYALDMIDTRSIICEGHQNPGVCLIYCRERDDDWYLDIYIYGIRAGKRIGCRRFVIRKGYQMDAADEEQFLGYMYDSRMIFSDRTESGLFNTITELEKDINLKEYSDYALMLVHIYFAINHSGLRELMFKAGGLENVAFNISLIEEYDYMADNIIDAMEVPIAMLRKFNTYDGVVNVLKYARMRRMLKTIYNRYHGMLNDVANLNYYQFYYLWECVENRISRPDKRILLELANLKDANSEDEDAGIFDDGYDYDELYENYMRYHSMLMNSGLYKSLFPSYPSLAPSGIEQFLTLYTTLDLCIKRGWQLNYRMKKLAKELTNKYSYEDEKYVIVVPECIGDILKEAKDMHNCLAGYIESAAVGWTCILFMREKCRPAHSLVSIEIRGGKLAQARQKCNRQVTDSQRDFLKRFAKAKGLSVTRSCFAEWYYEEDAYYEDVFV